MTQRSNVIVVHSCIITDLGNWSLGLVSVFTRSLRELGLDGGSHIILCTSNEKQCIDILAVITGNPKLKLDPQTCVGDVGHDVWMVSVVSFRPQTSTSPNIEGERVVGEKGSHDEACRKFPITVVQPTYRPGGGGTCVALVLPCRQ